jgi:hypothetical protein
MPSRKGATSALGSGWYRNKSRPEIGRSSAPYHAAANRYLRVLFVQAARVVLNKLGPKQWERYGLKAWIEAAKKRLHHNMLAIALANKLARIAWAVLNKRGVFECVKTTSQPA